VHWADRNARCRGPSGGLKISWKGLQLYLTSASVVQHALGSTDNNASFPPLHLHREDPQAGLGSNPFNDEPYKTTASHSREMALYILASSQICPVPAFTQSLPTHRLTTTPPALPIPGFHFSLPSNSACACSLILFLLSSEIPSLSAVGPIFFCILSLSSIPI
jgi:hypothetical protein